MNNAVELHKISVSEMDNQCYLLCAGNEALLIDASADAPALLSLAEDHGVTITAVLTTHRHWDHVRALEEVLDKTGATHYASFLDSPALPAPVDVDATTCARPCCYKQPTLLLQALQEATTFATMGVRRGLLFATLARVFCYHSCMILLH